MFSPVKSQLQTRILVTKIWLAPLLCIFFGVAIIVVVDQKININNDRKPKHAHVANTSYIWLCVKKKSRYFEIGQKKVGLQWKIPVGLFNCLITSCMGWKAQAPVWNPVLTANALNYLEKCSLVKVYQRYLVLSNICPVCSWNYIF